MSKLIAVNNDINPDTLKIEYFFGNVCNYKCWYCFPGSNSGEKRWPDLALIKKNLGHLIKQYQQYGKKKFQIKIIGGEPTIWPELGEFAEFFSKQFGCLISISTNGSRTIRWWEENAKHFEYIDISVHHAEADIDHIISVADCIYDQNVYVAANVLMDFTCWDKCLSIIKHLKKSNRRWYIAATDIQVAGEWKYTEEQKEFLSNPIQRFANPWYFLKTHKVDKINCSITHENGKSQKVSACYLPLNNLNRFFNWECYAGVDRIHIDVNGKILACTMQQLPFDEKAIRSIYDENFEQTFTPSIKPTICKKQSCNCTAEIILRKTFQSV